MSNEFERLVDDNGNVELVRAISARPSNNPGILQNRVSLAFMSNGAILKRREVFFERKNGEFQGRVQVYPWQVKRRADSYPYIQEAEFVERFKAKGYVIIRAKDGCIEMLMTQSVKPKEELQEKELPIKSKSVITEDPFEYYMEEPVVYNRKSSNKRKYKQLEQRD